jgi:heat shock transcription factor
MLFYDCHRSVPAPFLTKTYHLVNDPSTNDVVSWGEDDTTFVVWRPPEFARDLLPNYFKHNNFSSFVRQLNTYVSAPEFAMDWNRHVQCLVYELTVHW